MIVPVGKTGQMDHTTRLDRARQDGERIITLCTANMEAPVPSCPDWDGAGLLSHLTRVWHMLAIIVEERREGFPGRDDFPPRPAEGEEAAGAQTALARVIAAMAAVEPGTAMWSWGTTQSIDYFHRRLHLENLVHRVDAEQMAGISSEIDTDEAADAVAERFEEFVHARPERPSGSFHIHRTDGDGEWTAKVEATASSSPRSTPRVMQRQGHRPGTHARDVGSGTDRFAAGLRRGIPRRGVVALCR